MGAFNWLKQALKRYRQEGYETTPEAKNFVNNYGNQVEAAKQSLQERQEKERKERSSSEADH